MTPEAQRIAIAEACGWTIPDWCITKRRQRGEKERSLKGATPDFGSHPTVEGDLPDYLNSLDAMHEAEKVLQPSQTFAYIEHLRQIVDPQPTDMAFTWLMFQATAAQRAEAFLRTLGKWEDGK